MKDTFIHFLKPLSYICNLSLSNGIFPHELKKAKVIPLFKHGDNQKVQNYRPISVLPFFSKIFEKMMFNRIFDFINANKVLYDYQFGFRQNHSTAMALISLTDKIINAMENGEFAIGVFLDFSKAFDTVDHNILFMKLEHYGIRGLALSWIKSYLYQRTQYVHYLNADSNIKYISCGVPQGSILGPLLFLLYIHDIVNVSTDLFYTIYADDTNVFLTGNNLLSLYQTMNNELGKIVTWLNSNRLSLNILKSHYMIFTNKTVVVDASIQINSIVLERVESTKFLGVYLDTKLDWKKHISYVKSKIARGVGIIRKARKYLNKESLLTLYYSFIYPYFIYGIEVWGNAYHSTLASVMKLQKLYTSF